jgi:hypothetical protein
MPFPEHIERIFEPSASARRRRRRCSTASSRWGHIVHLLAAIEWFRAKSFRIYILRGDALPGTHEVNAAKPVTPAIVALHNRTVESVTRALDLTLSPAMADDEELLANSNVMNTGLANTSLSSARPARSGELDER